MFLAQIRYSLDLSYVYILTIQQILSFLKQLENCSYAIDSCIKLSTPQHKHKKRFNSVVMFVFLKEPFIMEANLKKIKQGFQCF